MCLYIRQIYFVFPSAVMLSVGYSQLNFSSLSFFLPSLSVQTHIQPLAVRAVSPPRWPLCRPRLRVVQPQTHQGPVALSAPWRNGLTNPVRKLSAGATGTAKGERQVRRLEGKPPPPPARSSQDLGCPPNRGAVHYPASHRQRPGENNSFMCIISLIKKGHSNQGYHAKRQLRQGKFIYIAHFIHNGNSKCFT